jgi:hypothetical protein
VPEQRCDPLERPGHPRARTSRRREEPAHRIPAVAVGDHLDVRVGVRVDARGDRDRLGEVPIIVGNGDGLDGLRVRPDDVADPVREAGEGAAVPAVGEQLVGAEGSRGHDDPARGQGPGVLAAEPSP